MQLVRVVLVMGLLAVAAALATPKGRLPLALRGVARLLQRDGSGASSGQSNNQTISNQPVSADRVTPWKRLLSFALVLLALLLALA